jgi:hypothetical protein
MHGFRVGQAAGGIVSTLNSEFSPPCIVATLNSGFSEIWAKHGFQGRNADGGIVKTLSSSSFPSECRYPCTRVLGMWGMHVFQVRTAAGLNSGFLEV